jgi:hypothetical protein
MGSTFLIGAAFAFVCEIAIGLGVGLGGRVDGWVGVCRVRLSITPNNSPKVYLKRAGRDTTGAVLGLGAVLGHRQGARTQTRTHKQTDGQSDRPGRTDRLT